MLCGILGGIIYRWVRLAKRAFLADVRNGAILKTLV
jgi:hypothetical protein